MKLEVTKAELQAIKGLVSDCEGMLGNGTEPDESGMTPDDYWNKRIDLINRMLKKNNKQVKD